MQDKTMQQGQPGRQQGVEVELKTLLGIFIRRRWIILGVALPIIIISTFVTLRTTEKATANARVMLIGKQPETPSFSIASTNWDMEMSSAAQIVISLPVAELAAEAMYDTVQTMLAHDTTFPDFETVYDIKNSLIGEVDCMQVGESNILSISYSHSDPRYALIAVKHVMESYMNFSIQRLKNQPAVDYYTDQIDNLHVAIDTFFQRRADIINEAGIAALTNNASGAVVHIQDLQNVMFKVRSERKALEARLRSIEAAILTDPSYIPSSIEGQDSFSPTFKIRLDRLATELAELRSKFKEGSGHLVIKERELAEIWKELDHERSLFILDLRVLIDEIVEKENSLVSSIMEQEELLEGFPDINRRLQALDVQIRSQLDLLEALELKRGEVKLSAGADMRVSNIVPLDEPFIKAAVVGSKKSLYLVLAGFLAVFLGLIAGWFIDNQDHRIFDRVQAAQALDVPVLGSISSDRLGKNT